MIDKGIKSAKGLIALFALLAVASCTPIIRNHGYAPTEGELQEIITGVDTRGTVEDVIGQPATAGVVENQSWYYIGSSVRHFAFFAPREIEREVVAIRFDQRGVVRNIERFGLEDGRVVTLSRRVTETSVRDITFLSQLLRNFGRIDASQILNEE